MTDNGRACIDHSGVCVNIKKLEARMTKNEDRHDKCTGNVIRHGLFWTVIVILITLASSVSGVLYYQTSEFNKSQTQMLNKINRDINSIGNTVAVQNVQIAHISGEIKEMKNSINRISR